MKQIVLIIFLFILLQCVFIRAEAQMPAVQQNQARFTKEIWGGIDLHSQGFGITFNYAKFLTYKKKRYYSFDIVGMHHEKEYKIFGSVDENAKRYVYGKLNSFYVIRAGFGKRKIIYEKLRDKGLQISVNWTLGPSIGITKPVYLEVLKIDGLGQVVGVSLEKYDPEAHNMFNIYGRGPWTRGLSEIRFHPGGAIKFGFEFEYGDERDVIKAIEIGAVVDAYPWPIPIMTEINNHFIFPTVYINIMMGVKKY